MGKEYTVSMSKTILEMSEKPLRSKEQAVLLLLYTIRMIDVSHYLKDERKECITISISKMSRIFYRLPDKMFSMHFPFSVEDGVDEMVIYSTLTGTNISSTVLSFLIEAFEKMVVDDNISFDTFFEIVMDNEYEDEDFGSNQMWLLVLYLLKYDVGYLRYDYDPKHEKGKLHPLNHIDVFLESSASFKVGLEERLSFEKFVDFLDTNTECTFLTV